MTILKPKPLTKKLTAQKALFDDLVLRYKTPDYIPTDPISHPHRFINDSPNCELVAFITALFSYGRRDIIIPTVGKLLALMGDNPHGFLQSFDAKKDAKLFAHFIYRFNKPADVVFLLKRLKWAYAEFETLENLFSQSARLQKAHLLQDKIAAFLDTLSGVGSQDDLPGYGLKFLFAHPANGGACKRFNMFLRWVVRHDSHPELDLLHSSKLASPNIDLGLWKKALTPGELLIPLDTHVGKMNQHFGFSKRQDNSWRTAEEITAVFRRFCPEDPVRYDYALMGYSLSGDWRK
ncbi:MAG: TIGR02757 family protein [Vampirovibrionales bacterium]|nr:TIGR02757 family protein [Vampirovibrionales bacterium]